MQSYRNNDLLKTQTGNMKKCKNCKHWLIKSPDEEESLDSYIYDERLFPTDPDTYKKMKMPFEVRICHSPELLEFERPIKKNQASVCDGSEYYAALYTAEDFGCVKWEKK